MHNKYKFTLTSFKWWQFYFVVCLLLILNTSLYRYVPDFSQKWRVMAPFDLSAENNLSVWWSSICIFAAGVIALTLSEQMISKVRNAWVAFAFLLVVLSCDEIGSIHERVSLYGGWWALLPFGLFIVSLIIFVTFRFKNDEESRRSILPISIAFLLFGIEMLSIPFL